MLAADFAVHAWSISKTESELTSAWKDDEPWEWVCWLKHRTDHEGWANFQKLTYRRLKILSTLRG